jgi:acylphosphatase
MRRAVIIAKGRVQRVGYRDEVEERARRLKITGFVENVKPYDVRIVAEGEDENIDQFIALIRIKKYPIDVESIEVNFEDFKAEFEYFEIKRGEWGEEIVERLDTAGKLLYKSVTLGEKSVELGEESVKIGEKMLEKQDETIGEIRGLREDLKIYMEERFDRIEQEIGAIKSKVGMV